MDWIGSLKAPLLWAPLCGAKNNFDLQCISLQWIVLCNAIHLISSQVPRPYLISDSHYTVYYTVYCETNKEISAIFRAAWVNTCNLLLRPPKMIRAMFTWVSTCWGVHHWENVTKLWILGDTENVHAFVTCSQWWTLKMTSEFWHILLNC